MPLLLYMSGQSQGKRGLAYIRFRLSAQEQEIVTWICRQSFPTHGLVYVTCMSGHYHIANFSFEHENSDPNFIYLVKNR